MLCRCRRRARCWCLLILVTLTCGLLFLGFIYHRHTCSTQESLDLLNNVCLQYSQDRITGDICEDLCVHKTITFQYCLNYRGGKKILVCSYENTDIILKSFKKDFDDLNVVENNIDLNQFYDIISSTLYFHFNVSLEKYADFFGIPLKDVGRKFAEDMWHGTMVDLETVSKSELKIFMYSLWVLLHQEEYITMQTLQSSKHIPRILGTCGSIYAMESASPGSILSQGISSFRKSHPWREKAKIALGILDLLESFSDLGPLHKQLHLCDVKGENFGIGQDGIVKAIDVDMAFVEDKMSSELAAGNCSTHRDCDFFECLGWCNLEKGKCTTTRRNNNLQSVCYKLFKSKTSNALQGLLSNPPGQYADRLSAILNDCIHPPAWDDEVIKYRASDETMHELRAVLKESLLV